MNAKTGRVLFVSSLLNYGGGERWMCDAATGLSARGHSVRLAARPASALASKAESLGIRVERVEMRGDFDPVAITSLCGVVRRFQPDVICPNLDREIRISSIALGMARKFPKRSLRNTKLIPRRGSEFPLKNKSHYRYFYTRFVHKVIVNSMATHNTMRSATPWFPREKAVMIYNGIDFSVYDRLLNKREELRRNLRQFLQIPEDAVVVVLVGELNERKGQRLIIDAAAGLVQSHPRTHFLFVGEGDARGDIERSLEKSDLAAAVSLVGFREDVPELLVASDIAVLPSRVEGFGYVLVEAMAASLPIVASRASSILEIVEDGVNGLLHEVGDSPAIAAHLDRLLANPDQARGMGARGRELAKEKFNVERMLDEVEALFFAGEPI